MAGLTQEMRDFLDVLVRSEGPTTSRHLKAFVSHPGRQGKLDCQQHGYAKWSDGVEHARGWQITEAGKAARLEPLTSRRAR